MEGVFSVDWEKLFAVLEEVEVLDNWDSQSVDYDEFPKVDWGEYHKAEEHGHFDRENEGQQDPDQVDHT